MNSSPPLALRLAAKTRKGLALLAEGRRSSAEAIAAEALESFVAQELSIMEKIERGRKSVREGRVASHDDVMRDAEALLRDKRKTRARKAKRA